MNSRRIRTMKTVCVYGLVDPDTKRVRYVGITDDKPRRLKQHIMDGFDHWYRSFGTKKARWVARLLKAGRIPRLIVLQGGIKSEREALPVERETIRRLTRAGARLLNGTHLYSPFTGKRLSI